MYSVEIETLPVHRLAALPHLGPYPEIRRVFERLAALLGERALWPQVSTLVGVYHDDPDKVEQAALKSHAGALVEDGFPVAPPLQHVVLPAGRHAVLHYSGPADGLAEAWGHLTGAWLDGSDESMGEGAAFEIYRNAAEDIDPTDLRIDLCLPLA